MPIESTGIADKALSNVAELVSRCIVLKLNDWDAQVHARSVCIFYAKNALKGVDTLTLEKPGNSTDNADPGSSDVVPPHLIRGAVN